MTLLDSPGLDQARDTGTTPLRLVRAEIMKTPRPSGPAL